MLHSTRGGAPTLDQEHRGTISWFLNPGAQASSHYVVGPAEVVQMVDLDLEAWTTGWMNAEWLAIEIAQPRRGDPITDFQYRATAWCLLQMRARFGFPLDRAHLPFHSEVPQGIQIGKTDPFPRGSDAGRRFYDRLFRLF